MNKQYGELQDTGRLWLRDVLSPMDLDRLDAACVLGSGSRRVEKSTDLLKVLGPGGAVAKALAPFMQNALPTRVVSFTKSETDNWGVPWHQDRVIAVTQKCDMHGYANWSKKAGSVHCEPPIEVLEDMLFLRIHLDDDTDVNGAMQIAVKSHRLGRVEGSRADPVANEHQIETCRAKRGDVLVLKMLTLHRSCPSRSIANRRVLRVDYANAKLPAPLEWGEWSTSA